MTDLRFRAAAIAIALLGSIAIAACSDGSTEAHGNDAHAAKSSSAGLPTGHVAAGETLATTKRSSTGQSCIDCHGENGNGPIDASYPKLGGQYASYLARSLLDYRDGTRENPLMSGQARDLTDQEIADLAAYFGSRPGELYDLGEAH
ncbi:MAG: cytochrome c [Lysobacter sp.]|nr:cytochrome c [Lysobacter sp.]MDQ3269610.1 cytochrome c [Pseudomonadota bacterium]